ncbi:hypothetical protein B296_00026465 [Ensete ventricosum]|uniref:Uncharacterized protein n=1 Tax=Ensete ventricosum TaxID=4639 RepID=A0A426Y6P2_ENSVE|nr:hypothetical protein B296_00026465 [Ensete ventricosum]
MDSGKLGDGFSLQDRHVTNVLEATHCTWPTVSASRTGATHESQNPSLSPDGLRAPPHVRKVTPAMGQFAGRRIRGGRGPRKCSTTKALPHNARPPPNESPPGRGNSDDAFKEK